MTRTPARVAHFLRELLIVSTAVQGLAFAQSPSADSIPELDAALAAYQDAYNRGDAAALMALWAPNADFISFTGQHYQGREAITALFRTAFAGAPGRTIQLEVKHRQRLSDDTVMDDGVLQLNAADGRIDRGRYVTIWSKDDGKWRIRSVRDMPPLVDPAPRDPLGELAWLVGTWKAKDGDVSLDCRWRGEKKLLEMRYKIGGEAPLEVLQLVGWDPASQQIRSWFFDTQGGFGEGVWSPRDDAWRVSSFGVLPDGRSASSIDLWSAKDGNFHWSSTEREVDGARIADIQAEYVPESTPAKAAAKSAGGR